MKKILVLVIVIPLFVSCARNMYVDYQVDSANTGTVVVKPSKATSATYVTIDDNLIVDKKSIKSVTIQNVPVGDHNIHYASTHLAYKEKIDEQIKVEMDTPRKITKLVEVPPLSTGYWIAYGVIFFAILGPVIIL